MDPLYSWSLLVALVSGAVGVVLAVGAAVQGRRGTASFVWLGLGGLALAVSTAVHAGAHGPCGPEPMGAATFLADHPSVLVAAAALAVGVGGALVAAGRRPPGG